MLEKELVFRTLKLLIKKYKIISITKSKNKLIENLIKNKQVIENYYHELGKDIKRIEILLKNL